MYGEAKAGVENKEAGRGLRKAPRITEELVVEREFSIKHAVK